ncbi:MAG: MFS transporter, partial [Alphaproteobacteria bacterium]
MTACIVWGVATSVGGAAPAAYAADNAPPGLNATTMSTFRMVGDLGYVIGPMLLGFIADASTPSVSLIVGSIMMVCAVLVFGVLAPESYTGGKRSKAA